MNAQAPQRVLALNLGSTGLKAALFDCGDGTAVERAREAVAIPHDDAPAEAHARDALDRLVARMPVLAEAPEVVVHRIVHGGERAGLARLDEPTLAALDALSPLAPLHQAPALALARAAAVRWPRARQLGAFDTAWHRSMPLQHRVYPLPIRLYAEGVRRYGFHGLAFQSALRRLRTLAPELTGARLVFAHLGGGSSLCAVLDGLCVNTTMGLTPLGGLPMATRSGSLDPGVLLRLQGAHGMDLPALEKLLWKDSGLLGLSGESADMRVLLASTHARARLAVDVYVGAVAQGIAAMAACIGGIDALCFSGGVGVHADPVRARIAERLAWCGVRLDDERNRTHAAELTAAGAAVRTFVIEVDEEREMAEAACASTARG